MNLCQRYGNRVITFSIILFMIPGCIYEDSRQGYDEVGPMMEIAPKVHTISIGKRKVEPAETIIKVGDDVIFQNNDNISHKLIKKQTKSCIVLNLKPKQSWKYKPDASEDFYCSAKPQIKGRIIIK